MIFEKILKHIPSFRNPCENGVSTDDLIDKWTQERSTHIIIEGNPGTGKSTLSQKVAYIWSSAKSSHPLCRRFDLVFFIEGRHIKRRLLDAIYEIVLPDNFVVGKSRLHELLEKPDIQEKTLFIIDAFDELASPHGDVMRLVRRKLYSRCSLLVTSRPTYSDEIIRYFDAGYVLLGLPFEQRREFVHKYAEVHNMPRSRYRDLEDSMHDNKEIAELSKTPLYLWFLCMLLEERGGTIPKTRTTLYNEVIAFLLRKIEWQQKLNPSVTSSFLNRIGQLAFASVSEARVDLDGYSERVSQLARGNLDLHRIFLTRVAARTKIKPQIHYAFTHRSIQEFLAARHMVRMRPDERLGHINTHCNQRHWDMVWAFLAGLLEGDDPSLDRLYRRAICKDMIGSQLQKSTALESDDSGHGKFHLGLQCLAESGTFANFSELSAQIMPTAFIYRVMTCHFCLRGWVRAHADETPRLAPDLVIPSMDIQTYQRFDHRLLHGLKENNHMEGLVFSEVFSISMVTEYITKFCASKAPMKRLYIYLADFMHPEVKESSCEVSRLRALHRNLVSLKSVVFIGSKSRLLKGAELTAEGIEHLLASLCWNIGANMETIVLVEHSLSDVTGLTLTAAMRHCTKLRSLVMQRIRMHPSSLTRFLTVLADASSLRHMALDHCDLTAPAADLALPRRITLIISKCKISNLSMQGACEKNLHLTHILRALRDNRNLTRLDLSESVMTNEAWTVLADILPSTAVDYLALRSMNRLPEQFIASLRNVRSLHELDISGNDFGDDSIFSKVCINLATQDHITAIHLEHCRLNDSHLPSISTLVLSGHIHVLYMRGNLIGEIDPALKAIHDLFNRCFTLHVLYVTICHLDVPNANKLAGILAQHKQLTEIHITTLPAQELMSRDAFAMLVAAFRDRVPRTVNFTLGFCAELNTCNVPEDTEHGRWRKLCLGLDQSQPQVSNPIG